MLKSVFFVFCLFCLSCFALFSPPSCVNLDVTNCAPYYCVIAKDTTSSDPNAVKCAEDPCYTIFKTTPATCSASGAVCQRTEYQDIPGETQTVCARATNHFSYCRLTTEALSIMHAGDDKKFPAMEEYCEDLGCGGLYAYFDDYVGPNNEGPNVYFHCEEPNNDGTLGPDDFDESNCKKFDFKVVDGKCDWDPCSYYPKDNGDPCPSDNCKNLTDDGSTLCVDKSQTVCGVASWNLDGITSDGCASMECGGLDVAKSKRGNSYLYCLPPPPPPKKSSASYLHVSAFALVITIFAFL